MGQGCDWLVYCPSVSLEHEQLDFVGLPLPCRVHVLETNYRISEPQLPVAVGAFGRGELGLDKAVKVGPL